MGTTLPFRSTEPEDDYQGCSAPPTDENWVVFPLEFDPIAGTVVSSEPSVPSDPSLGSLCDVAAPVWNMTYLQGSTSHFEAQQTMPIRGHHGWASSMNAFEFQLDQEPVSNDLYYWDSEASNTSFSELQSLVNRDTSTSQMIYGDPTTPVDSFSSTFLGAELLSGYTQISASDALEDSSTGPVYYSDLPSDTVNIGESLGQLGPTARPFDSTNYIPDQSFGGASGEALVSSSQPFSYEDGGTCLDNAFPPGVKVMELLETPSQGIPSITPSSVKRKSRSSPSPEPDRAEPIPAKKSKSRRKKKDSRTDQSPCLHCKRRKVAVSAL
ncbi:hypothetical protein BJ508DRAFT_163470 [Ascobolus immersus RN42]|uniref:Uncharacterized protein n=1 Tax=Ascobolus immersus RN42 TaxID=1160509 RepID=A0A3N4HVW9_ASCIM|nr:hypothetical protein BJ508DRAFT_163470 [Ascobolus immersus RN42]